MSAVHWLSRIKSKIEYDADRAKYSGYINRLNLQLEQAKMELDALRVGAETEKQHNPGKHELSVVSRAYELFSQLEGKARLRAMKYVLELLSAAD